MSSSWRDEVTRPSVARIWREKPDQECHWSPWCDREGTHYETVFDPPTEVWACDRCCPTGSQTASKDD